MVRDESKPTFTVGGIPGYASGAMDLSVDARDTGLGLASISATFAGVPVATLKLGQNYCAELSPGDSTADLPLAEDCPAASRTTVVVDTTAFADGIQHLQVVVTDAAGNFSVRDYDVKVINHPPVVVVPTPTPTPRKPVAVAPTPTSTPTPTPVKNVGVLKVAKRYSVSRAGSLKVDVSCPAAAPASCRLSLKLAARLPGRKRSATIATASRTARPGARAKITMKLSSSARRALAKKQKLSAVLTLAGAAPVTVQLRR